MNEVFKSEFKCYLFCEVFSTPSLSPPRKFRDSLPCSPTVTYMLSCNSKFTVIATIIIITFFFLKDSSRDIREALHELLCCTNVSTKEGIHLALVELLKNLTKYPTDRDSIWK